MSIKSLFLIPVFCSALYAAPEQFLLEFQFTDLNQKSETWTCRTFAGSSCQIHAEAESVSLNVHARVSDKDGHMVTEYFFEHSNRASKVQIKAQGQTLTRVAQSELLQQSSFGTLRLKLQKDVIDLPKK